MTPQVKCPCRYCQERYEACWDSYPKYKEWKAIMQERRENRVRENEVRAIMRQNAKRWIRHKALHEKKG